MDQHGTGHSFAAESGEADQQPDRGAGPPLIRMPDWRAVVRGNWVGAGVVALGAAVTAGLLGLLLALLAKPPDFGLEHTLTLATLVATGAFGADTQFEDFTGTGLGPVSGSAFIGWFPLTVTILASLVAVLLFRRVTRGYPSWRPALADAVRASALFGIFLFIPAVVFSSSNDQTGRGWAAPLSSGALGFKMEINASAGGALVLGFLTMLLVLALAVLARGDWWTGRMVTVRNWAAGPLAGWVAFVLLLPVAGLISWLATAFTGVSNELGLPGDETRVGLALSIAFLANEGFLTAALGAGSRVGGVVEGGVGFEPTREWARLWGTWTEDEPGLWVSPLILVAMIALCAVVVLRASRTRRPVVSLAIWLGTFLLVLPLLVRVANLHGGGRLVENGARVRFSALVGADGFQTVLLLLVVAALVSAAVTVLTGVVAVGEVTSGVARAARSVQSVPGAAPSTPPAPSPSPDATARTEPGAPPETPATEPGPSEAARGEPGDDGEDPPRRTE